MTQRKPPKVDSLQIRKEKALIKWRQDPISNNITQLAIDYDISKSSLYAAATHNRKSHILGAERLQHFTQAEEDVLVQWCCKLIEWGHPPRVETLRTMAFGLLQEKTGRSDIRVGKHWTERFLKRNKELETTFSRALNNNRAKATHPETVRRWFGLLIKVLEEYKIQSEVTQLLPLRANACCDYFSLFTFHFTSLSN